MLDLWRVSFITIQCPGNHELLKNQMFASEQYCLGVHHIQQWHHIVMHLYQGQVVGGLEVYF